MLLLMEMHNCYLKISALLITVTHQNHFKNVLPKKNPTKKSNPTQTETGKTFPPHTRVPQPQFLHNTPEMAIVVTL